MDLEPFKNCFAHENAIYISNDESPLKPCCFFNGGANATSWKEYRESIDKIPVDVGCRHCILSEKGGSSWSHRQQYEQDFYSKNGKIFVIGVCFDNICNIKCTTCSPAHSSQWIEDYTKLNLWEDTAHKKKFIHMTKQAPAKIELIKDILKNITFDTIRFDIYGGEPTINPLIVNFIDWLADSEFSSKIIISLTTNGTAFFNKIIRYTTRFKYIQIQLSIDGINEYYDYLRYGAKWDVTKENTQAYLEFAKTASNVLVSVNYTLSWMNSLNFVDFYEWALTNLKNLQGLYLTKVTGPKIYSVDILQPKNRIAIRDIVADKIKTLDHSHLTPAEKNMFDRLFELYQTAMINYSTKMYNELLDNRAVEKLNSLDQIRNTDYKKTFAKELKYLDLKELHD
jgi:organic radical activating enzyme